ncbi:radical SAM/SPASM domain-containing protein [Lachnospiraceae bacterium SGI.231]
MKKKRFQKIYIEIINRCNLSCSFCPTSDRPARMMSVDEFAKIAAQVTPFTDYICLHVKGEPLMHPWLGDILAIAHQNGLKVNLTTNAVLLPEKHQLLLGETAPRQISLSLHSFDANTMHTRDFRSYLENAIDFARTFTMTTPGYISFRLWNLDGTAKADQRLRNQFILEALEQAYHLAQPIDAYVGKVHGNTIAPHTYVNFDQLFEWPDEHASDYGFNGTCHGLRHQLAILADGQVVPCCLDHNGHLALGNIFIESLDTILCKEKSLRIIEDFRSHHIHENLCRRCGYRTRF